MQKDASVKWNLIYSTGYQVFRIIIPFITTPYLSRVLGVGAIGIQSYTASIQAYFLTIATLGTLTYGTREIARNRDDATQRSKTFWEIEILTIVTSFISLLGWMIVIGHDSNYRTIFGILSIGIIAVSFDISWFFNGMELFKLMAIRSTLIKIIGTLCIFFFIKSPVDLTLYILINTLTTLLSNLTLWLYLPKYLIRVNPKEFQFKNHLKETLVFFVPNIASSVYTILDKTLIGIVSSDTSQNGFYEQAERIISLAKCIVYQPINAVVGARNSFLYIEKKTEEIKRRIDNSFNYILFMGFGCCFGLMGISKTFIPFFFGTGYEGVIPLIYILCPIIVIIGISNCLDTQYYTPFGKQKTSAKLIVIGAILNFFLNLFLIPKFEARGAAFASILAEFVILIFYIKCCDEYGRLSCILKIGYKKMIAGFLMFLIVDFLNMLSLAAMIRLVIQIVMGCLFYIMFLLFLHDKWVIKYVKKIFDKEKFKKR